MKALAGKEFAKLLEQRGWSLNRVKGSHHTFVKEGELFPVTVPIHGSRDLPQGMQRALMKQTGLKESDL